MGCVSRCTPVRRLGFHSAVASCRPVTVTSDSNGPVPEVEAPGSSPVLFGPYSKFGLGSSAYEGVSNIQEL